MKEKDTDTEREYACMQECCICVGDCIYVCVNAYCIYVYVSICLLILFAMCVLIKGIHTYLRDCAFTDVYSFLLLDVCVSVFLCVCMCECVYVSALMCVCMYLYVYVLFSSWYDQKKEKGSS
ncbi:Hypothetical predicted protein [Octopus vulgaris]|uniref:Uncharacterized protein n=1 Tax=Octopus vulgaris TaxID=6645 RepID=A0AA36F903_OCTVU|nr:Hypothetical predicted protein [Octopus vulgaris]